MRSGTDIAFLGGMINYIIKNNLYFNEYVAKYTNASYLVNPEFKGPGELNGIFSGYDEKTRKYDKRHGLFRWMKKDFRKRHDTKRPELRIPASEETLLKIYD